MQSERTCCPPSTALSRVIAFARPLATTSSSPSWAGVMVTSVEPSVPVPSADSGALTETGRSATGIRSLVGPDRTILPNANSPNGASVRAKVTASSSMSPTRPATRVAGASAVKPGMSTRTFQVPFIEDCSVRVKDAEPATWPCAIDGRFSSVGASAGTPVSRPWPVRNPRHSRALELMNQPGSRNFFGFTMPAPWARASVLLAPSESRVGLAVVIIADWISCGVQSGCRPCMNAARPAMCGAAIDVPE